MTNLEKLEEAIYKELPRLKEIKVGQRFHSTFYGEIICTKIEYTKYNFYRVYGYDVKECLPRCDYYPNYLKLLGQEIALNDVLEWLEIKHSNKDYFIDTCGQLQRNVERIDVTWDLSKPLLKDQSIELINYLTELI